MGVIIDANKNLSMIEEESKRNENSGIFGRRSNIESQGAIGTNFSPKN